MGNHMNSRDLGPQYRNDDPFTARMRRHQSWHRATVLQVPCGPGPHASSTNTYGNMLREQDGERGLNFLTPELAAFALHRQGEFPKGIKRHRLLCNLMSSQPMCFNLFGPLALGVARAEDLLAALLGVADVRRVVRVVIEHAPSPASDYLDDLTSF
ncbi:MAG: PGN_0703 family putative restriction endonuclease, partial [Polyangiaceae bacterium]